MGGSHLKNFRGRVVFQKYYIIFRLGHGKYLRLITRWVGGVKKGQNNAYVIFEWSLMDWLWFFTHQNIFLIMHPVLDPS